MSAFGTCSGVTLTEVPTEVILHIFDYLPVRTLLVTVRRVCKRFADMLSDDAYFKNRFKKKYRKDVEHSPFLRAYGLFEDRPGGGRKVTWTDMAVRADIQESFSTSENWTEHYSFGLPHTLGVDTVKLLDGGRVCVTGGRDKTMCLWDVEDLTRPAVVERKAHGGWIWDLAGHSEDAFFSCGWDGAVKEWSTAGGLECVRQFRTECPAMRLASLPGLLLAGLLSGKVFLVDPRAPDREGQSYYRAHRGPITGLYVSGDSALSVGQDRRMVAVDLRTTKRYFSTSDPGSCPRCTSAFGGLWYWGGTLGRLRVHDLGALREPVFDRTLWERKAVNAIRPTMAGAVVGTSDGRLAFLSTIRSLGVHREVVLSGEITSIDFKKNVLAIGSSDDNEVFHVLKLKDLTDFTA